MRFGELLCSRRGGRSQAWLASRVGVGASYISALELGRRLPTYVVLLRLVEVLGDGGLLEAGLAEVYPEFGGVVRELAVLLRGGSIG